MMSVHDREQTYLQLLSEGEYTVSELSKRLFISEPTVRRDILVLEKKELLTCRRGVVKLKSRYADQRVPLFIRNELNNKEKQEIALMAVRHVKDGDVIMMDASTTAYHLIPHLLQFKNILLITNGAKTALEAASLGIRTHCTGGEMTPESFSYVGSDAETMLKNYNADVAFFSCLGLNDEGVASDSSLLENAMRRIMIRNSRRQFLLCDRSKMGHTYLNTLCLTSDLSGVITNY